LDIVSVERLRIELDKLVIAPDPTPGLDLARRTGLLTHVLPELAALSSADWDRCTARLVRVAPSLLPRLATLVLAIDDALRAPRLDALRHPRRVTHAAVELARGVERFVASPPRTDAELRRAVVAAGGGWAEVLELARSIEPGLGVDLVVRRSAELDADLGALGTDAELPIDGRDVIEILGVDTGPLVGDALDVVRAARLDHGPLDATTARRLLTEWWSSRPVR
ncbi:MAG: hypothetical protein KDB21_16470, partial [Acidimicrobiales bacterium]|nr:hypothetical protein [Acidimicrobiales bacterium]